MIGLAFSATTVREILRRERTAFRLPLEPQPSAGYDTLVTESADILHGSSGAQWARAADLTDDARASLATREGDTFGVATWPGPRRIRPPVMPHDRIGISEPMAMRTEYRAEFRGQGKRRRKPDGFPLYHYVADSAPVIGTSDPANVAGLAEDVSAIDMPPAFSRVVLEATRVTLERLHVLRGAPALLMAEAHRPVFDGETVASLAELYVARWDAEFPAHPWATNPWTWRVDFRRVAP